jgi:hypothetical protein
VFLDVDEFFFPSLGSIPGVSVLPNSSFNEYVSGLTIDVLSNTFANLNITVLATLTNADFPEHFGPTNTIPFELSKA